MCGDKTVHLIVHTISDFIKKDKGENKAGMHTRLQKAGYYC